MIEAQGEQAEPRDPRLNFAAERTLLAWIRTGLAMMGFGFVVARFGLFLRELASVQGAEAPRRVGLSLWIGTTLVVLGVVASVWAAITHWRTVRRLERNEPLRFRPFSLVFVVAIALAAIGAITAVYLVFGLAEPS
jgi:putative membrane protein